MYYLPLALLGLPLLAGGAATNTTRSSLSHSLSDPYQFDSRDGWHSVLVTNLRYKYRRSHAPFPPTTFNSSNPPERSSSTHTVKRILRSVRRSLADITKGIVAIGRPEAVTITWYTGHDLLNPSCWTHSNWAPTDNSFVAALTLDGWPEKPKCFKFIEICNNRSKCIFVRVVDTCAGCQKGSKHVDLTRAAFKELSSLETGVLTAQMREATEPTIWSVDLWGPRDTKDN